MKLSYVKTAMLYAASLSPFFMAQLSYAADSAKDSAKDSTQNQIIELRERLEKLKQDSADQIDDLEERLEATEELQISTSSPTRSANAFNPAIGLILVGNIGSQLSAAEYTVPGFSLPDEAGPAADGFSLGESELNINANIDDKFFGNMTVAVASDGTETELELEEAYIQTLALPGGLNMTAGRFFSGVGYLNGFHAHTDTFADRPLAYEVFLGGQFKDDGLQLRWLLPTTQYLEVGTEVLRGEAFPAAGAMQDGFGTWTVFAETGGDLGINSNWKAGVAYLNASVEGRPINPADDISPAFSGDSKLINANFVWKWRPNGYSANSLKIQGEFFSRTEQGDLDTRPYSAEHSGWYLEGNWQFKAQWNLGFRHGSVDADNLDSDLSGTAQLTGLPTGLLESEEAIYRNTILIGWKNSEFSRIKFQFTDQSGLANDARWLVQYSHSLGAHGAHRY